METIEQQQNNILASNILYSSLAASFLLSLIGFFTIDAPPGTRSPLFGMLLLVHFLPALLYYAIRLGKRWAKILLLVLVALTFISTTLPLLNGDQEAINELREDVLGAVRQAITLVADIVALVLLFKKPPVKEAPIYE